MPPQGGRKHPHQEFTAVDPAGVHHRLRIRLPGRYNVANALLALAMLDAVGVSPEQASPGLREASVPGRLEAIERGQDFLAVVDYAHKPGALQAVLETLRRPGARLAVVFGAGGNRDPGKREPMGRIAADPGIFIRSMATRGALGGLARATQDAIDLLDAAGWDVILVETVGVGQDEVDVVSCVQTCCVVLVPGMGDEIQAIIHHVAVYAGVPVGVECMRIARKVFAELDGKA